MPTTHSLFDPARLCPLDDRPRVRLAQVLAPKRMPMRSRPSILIVARWSQCRFLSQRTTREIISDSVTQPALADSYCLASKFIGSIDGCTSGLEIGELA